MQTEEHIDDQGNYHVTKSWLINVNGEEHVLKSSGTLQSVVFNKDNKAKLNEKLFGEVVLGAFGVFIRFLKENPTATVTVTK